MTTQSVAKIGEQLSKTKTQSLQQTFWQISLPSSHDFDGNRGIAIVTFISHEIAPQSNFA